MQAERLSAAPNRLADIPMGPDIRARERTTLCRGKVHSVAERRGLELTAVPRQCAGRESRYSQKEGGLL
ncbi:MAG: hypothetical protein AMJ46_08150 [Latescibacteria bacterium DG_63]|nr:MAG: hypothetical protein AMJ46_08150 [Latescibacteria bacterium DG_63]